MHACMIYVYMYIMYLMCFWMYAYVPPASMRLVAVHDLQDLIQDARLGEARHRIGTRRRPRHALAGQRDLMLNSNTFACRTL